MSKSDADSTYGSKLLKLFRILLADRNRHYLSDLKKTLNCSSQTVLRLIEEIEREMGDNLEMGKNGRLRWYRLNPLNKTGRFILDNEDLKFFGICRDLADPYLPAQLKGRVDARLWELSLQVSDVDNIEDQSRFAFFSKGQINYTPYYATINTLLKAIKEKTVCIVQYRPSGEKVIKRHFFAPCKIAIMNGALYVLGTYVKEDFVTQRHQAYFAIHRLLDVVKTDHVVPFEPLTFDFKSFGLPWHPPRTFRIKFKKGKSADYVRERVWARQQRLEECPDGSLILEITTTSEPELMAFVRSFGEEATLLSKADLPMEKPSEVL